MYQGVYIPYIIEITLTITSKYIIIDSKQSKFSNSFL